jgi:hypothetical protein
LSGSLIGHFRDIKIQLADIVQGSVVFSIITITSGLIFLRGQQKQPESQTFHSIVALSVKFLLELVFALLWFVVTKKDSIASVIIFFVLYLSFTLAFIWFLLKTLKIKGL